MAHKGAWMWFMHNRSPKLQPCVGSEEFEGDLSANLRRDYARAIAIVSPDRIDDFYEPTWESGFPNCLRAAK